MLHMVIVHCAYVYMCVPVFALCGNADVVKPDGTDSSSAHDL